MRVFKAESSVWQRIIEFRARLFNLIVAKKKNVFPEIDFLTMLDSNFLKNAEKLKS